MVDSEHGMYLACLQLLLSPCKLDNGRILVKVKRLHHHPVDRVNTLGRTILESSTTWLSVNTLIALLHKEAKRQIFCVFFNFMSSGLE